MSINNINNNGQKQVIDNQKVNQQQTQNQQANEAAAKSTSSQPVRQDSVSLTQSAQQLAQVQKKSAEAPVNQEKVDRLKKAIQSGEYSVNPDSLAKNIALQESEIFGRN
ncbi:flagellar biosynthesis anti-sigma factor FlgM [Paraglaciecola mesophila]|uniref:Negative regulator of flagellin synthesis n=1 Tax=Paraglaciecola mesophila TaxID=197222 RepID=A0ABU9STA4_9ALTE|tara:strand:+ start:3349 stop:3675 length:327 start_codon:yes stop_codon:yes gene_type:complete|eukprot:TRINITY_DN726_c0_g2_i1.p1 TRINITY_DN726_c0_g2~~TRINITY_DN726_c0_g2_i1.p1  ORF type:complete len:109 (+),score=31.34 TRINITY_DN726_c0_g2_i1:318-644(+)